MVFDKEGIYKFFSKEKNILITGGAGFIGGAMVRRLISKTYSNIYNLDKLNYSSDLSSIKNLIRNRAKMQIGSYHDLKLDLSKKDDVNKALKRSDPDIIFNFAAESHVDRSIDNPEPFIINNIIGTFNLLEATRNHYMNLSLERKANFVLHHISTDEVFGSLDDCGLFNENTNYNPQSPYSASKASSDHLVLAWNNTYKLPVILTNCSNNYGPWQFPEKLIPLVILKALSGEEIPIYGDGSNRRDWLYVEDHIDAIFLAAVKGKKGSNYCIGGFGERSNREVVERICDLLDKFKPRKGSYKELIRFVEDRPGHDQRYAIDSSKIKNELGWNTNYSFEDGIRETVKWYLSNLDWCKKIQSKSGYKGKRIGLKS